MEQMILHWLQANIPLVMTWVLGIGGIGFMIKKYSPEIRKYIKVTREGLDLIDTLLDAVQDDKITDDEVKAIIAEVQAFKDSLK